MRGGADVAWANTPSQAEADNTIVTTAILVNALMGLFPERVDSMGEGTRRTPLQLLCSIFNAVELCADAARRIAMTFADHRMMTKKYRG
jgi:hypothetical protein